MKVIRSHRELEVYQLAFHATIKIYALTKSFPREELYSLTEQVRRSSRSVSANIYFRSISPEKILILKYRSGALILTLTQFIKFAGWQQRIRNCSCREIIFEC